MKGFLDYIDVYRGEVDPALCDKIVQTLSASSDWVDAKVGEGEVRQDYRHCEVVSLNHWPDLDSAIFSAVGKAIGYYRTNHPFADISVDMGYNVLRYEVGSFFKEHVDSYENNRRTLSCSIALNDDYEGGEMVFFSGEKIYRLSKGDIIMFPSSFTYPHQVLPITKGVRYSIVTWLN
jgi:predicted 2-oxoglutarate/Fe(II)-dependent dioxygenase YbiX